MDDVWTGTGTLNGLPYTLTVTGGTGSFQGASGTCDVTVSVQDLGGGHQTQSGSISCDVAQP